MASAELLSQEDSQNDSGHTHNNGVSTSEHTNLALHDPDATIHSPVSSSSCSSCSASASYSSTTTLSTSINLPSCCDASSSSKCATNGPTVAMKCPRAQQQKQQLQQQQKQHQQGQQQEQLQQMSRSCQNSNNHQQAAHQNLHKKSTKLHHSYNASAPQHVHDANTSSHQQNMHTAVAALSALSVSEEKIFSVPSPATSQVNLPNLPNLSNLLNCVTNQSSPSMSNGSTSSQARDSKTSQKVGENSKSEKLPLLCSCQICKRHAKAKEDLRDYRHELKQHVMNAVRANLCDHGSSSMENGNHNPVDDDNNERNNLSHEEDKYLQRYKIKVKEEIFTKRHKKNNVKLETFADLESLKIDIKNVVTSDCDSDDDLDEEDDDDDLEEELDEDDSEDHHHHHGHHHRSNDNDDCCSDEGSTTSTSASVGNSTNQRGEASRVCDCCYCEVFGHGMPAMAPTSKNYNEMRERLRMRLSKRKAEKCEKMKSESSHDVPSVQQQSCQDIQANGHYLSGGLGQVHAGNEIAALERHHQKGAKNSNLMINDQRDLDELIKFINGTSLNYSEKSKKKSNNKQNNSTNNKKNKVSRDRDQSQQQSSAKATPKKQQNKDNNKKETKNNNQNNGTPALNGKNKDNSKAKEKLPKKSLTANGPQGQVHRQNVQDQSRHNEDMKLVVNGNGCHNDQDSSPEVVFMPRDDVDLNNGQFDEFERELEEFKRFCYNSVPRDKKEKLRVNIKNLEFLRSFKKKVNQSSMATANGGAD